MFRRHPPQHWPALSIGPRQRAPEHLQGGVLISITEPGDTPPSWSRSVGAAELVHLPFTDSLPGQAGESDIMTAAQMDELAALARRIAPGTRVHVHCAAGSSRSPAVATALLRAIPDLRGASDEAILRAVLSARPRMNPNTWVLTLADQRLRSRLNRTWTRIGGR